MKKLYVMLKTDVRSKEGKLYAKKGKMLRVLFRNKRYYVCEVGKFTVPVFESNVECEKLITSKSEEEQEENYAECDIAERRAENAGIQGRTGFHIVEDTDGVQDV